MAEFDETPSQTAGPYVHIGCLPQVAGLEQRGMGAPVGATPSAKPTMTLDIEFFDGAGAQICDALVEIWHPDSAGQFGAQSWGRQATDFETGRVSFAMVKPAAPHGQAPHILVWIAARGINLGLTTRIYFPDCANEDDPVFALAGNRARTLVATKTDTGYAHKIFLQGPEETVFFDA